jgi:hypothetical protein
VWKVSAAQARQQAPAAAGSPGRVVGTWMEIHAMPTWLIGLTIAAPCYAAICRYGVDSRDGRYRRVHTVSGDLVTMWRAVLRVASRMRELEERRALLDRPWEEDFLHWARDEQGWHLHGHLAPPPRRRTNSVTSRGWCPGLPAHSHQTDRRTTALPDRKPSI